MTYLNERLHLMPYLMKMMRYRSYLEIGVNSGLVFNEVECERKVGVDPGGYVATHIMTSDEYFAANDEMFDLIFIDGEHEASQVKRDIENALKRTNIGGTIVLHDCLPQTEEQQTPKRLPDSEWWTGDGWKAFAWFRQAYNLCSYTWENDWGCGIIEVGWEPKKIFEPQKELTWDDYVTSKELLLAVVDTEWLRRRIEQRSRME